MMSISIPAWILVPLLPRGSRGEAGEALPFLAVCAVALGLAILFAREKPEGNRVASGGWFHSGSSPEAWLIARRECRVQSARPQEVLQAGAFL